MASQREGHLNALLHMFGFMRINHNSWMRYAPSYPTIDMNVFIPNDWKSFYGNVEESIPSNAPELRGKEVDLQLYVNSDHAGEWCTGYSRKFHEHCTHAVVLKITGHNRNLSFWS